MKNSTENLPEVVYRSIFIDIAEFFSITFLAAFVISVTRPVADYIFYEANLVTSMTGPTIAEVVQAGSIINDIIWVGFLFLGFAVMFLMFLLFRRVLNFNFFWSALWPVVAGVPLLQIVWIIYL